MMSNRGMSMRIALSSLVLGVAAVGAGSAQFGTAATASSRIDVKSSTARAEKALAAKNADKAIAFAEAAVSASPRDADLRTLLGRGYLAAGRLLSAETAFSDALTLDGGQGRAALNLALVQTALGKTDLARRTIADHAALFTPSDRGLALALAGDVPGAVALLEATIRADSGDARTRQNLALSYALAGRWKEARVMAAYDLTPADADARIIQWSQFVRPSAASDQVASLLGINPVVDAGQPEMLALAPAATPAKPPAMLAQARPAPMIVAVTAAASAVAETAQAVALAPVAPSAVAPEAPAPVPGLMLAAAPAAEPVASVVPAETAAPAISETRLAAYAGVTFAPRAEVVQALPASYTAYQPQSRAALYAPQRIAVAQVATRVARPAVQRAAYAPRSANGRYVVQLGAFSSAARLEAGWDRAVRRFGLLGDYTPSSTTFVRASTYHRLSVGGFETRAEAVALCEKLHAAGGKCFVRTTAGDAPLQWARRNTGAQLASR
ncbi:SPOR domain-containing protein [Sphingomonas flavalba]|uniref:SPOR domain-containing protein n=1 Tax=Sphingomonas flavalba TaxID=2559804 RepID=UPI00109D8DB3|nr:SPOR domain-containing protein [Sphingomonas flavalba]